MSTPLVTRIRLKIERVRREWRETPAEREWRLMWPNFDSIEGWLSSAEGKWLFDTAQSLPEGANIVEIGSFKGRSTCCLAAGCRGTKKHIFAIDSFDGGSDLPSCNSFPEFSENVKRCGVSHLVEPIKELSTKAAKTWNKPIHLLFIDGSHYYEEVIADFTGFFPYVASGGIVAFHDVSEAKPGVLKAWNETFQHQLTGIGHCETLGYGRKPKSNGHRAR